MPALTAYVRGVGVIGPGISDWFALQAVFAGHAALASAPTAIPPLAVLPAAERRRVGNVIKLALATGLQTVAAAAADASSLATVFASSGGDGANCHAICETLASDDRLISPTRFHNSVNNAASGYWGIATGAQAPSSIICAYDGSFAAGLLEALVQAISEQRPVLLIAHDAPYPEPLRAVRPIADAFGVGLLLTAQASAAGQAQITLALTDETVNSLANAPLEALRQGIPAARSLPLLACLARLQRHAETGRVVLDYLDDVRLAVSVKAAP
ncbi:beta-ketoacyl synthase chain length factor [Accumulibacter sp.]|uniref:beta-ketoacyl synthase chain length factor n=1 Tax=Accumulibacter sp. TaxID=2053492 RepID=UPI0028C4FFC3|nr:beta-ketoacyl synthase chain length factor [Accumulibacter sp.]